MGKNSILHSFKFALNGLGIAWKERNFKIHLVSAVIVLGFGIYFKVNSIEWLLLLICIGSVLSLELVNTALEKVVDLKSPEMHPLAGAAKDIAAGAVLVFSIISAIVAIVIFIPYFFN